MIVDLMESVHKRCGYERATICARDCLLQWNLGLLDETIKAWRRYLEELNEGMGHTDENRHGAWVPAIPL